MAQKNSISVAITPANKQLVLDNLSSIRSSLAELLQFNFSAADRHEMLKMGEKTMVFVEKSIGYALQHPELRPPYLDAEEARRDFSLTADLKDIVREMVTIQQGLEDVLMLAGSEAYAAALMFYSSVKGASRSDIAGSRAIYEDLAQRFPGRPRNKPDGE